MKENNSKMTKDNKCQNSDFRMETKMKCYFPYALRSFLYIQFVAVAFRSRKEVLWRMSHSMAFFCPSRDPSLGGAMCTTSLTNFVNIHQVVLYYWICVQIHIHALTPSPFLHLSQNDLVRKTSKNVKNASKIWLQNAVNNNNTSFHVLLYHCYAFGLLT